MSVLDLEEIRNAPVISLTSSSTPTHDKVSCRRKRVNELRLRGYTNKEIAEKIGCNLSTIEKDLAAIRENSRKWFGEDAITEYCLSLNDSIVLYDNMIEDLQILYSEADTVTEKLNILSMIAEFEQKKILAYEKTIAVRNYLEKRK